jgi:hypothetical protein
MDCRIARKIAASSDYIFQSSQSSRSAALGRNKVPPELDPELRAEWPRPNKRYPVRWRKSWPASCFIGAIATSLLLMACGHLQPPSPNDLGLAAKAPSNGSSLESPSVGSTVVAMAADESRYRMRSAALSFGFWPRPARSLAGRHPVSNLLGCERQQQKTPRALPRPSFAVVMWPGVMPAAKPTDL